MATELKEVKVFVDGGPYTLKAGKFFRIGQADSNQRIAKIEELEPGVLMIAGEDGPLGDLVCSNYLIIAQPKPKKEKDENVNKKNHK